MRVHLVDGTYELFRAYYGAPPSSAPDGTEVGATRALARSLLSLLKKGGTHVGVAFDTVIESFRNQLFAGYKTGAGIDPPLWAQFPLAEELTRALGLVTWSMIDFEADDALATFAARAAADPAVEQVLICSPDKDLCQCVRGDRVVELDRRREIVLDEEKVIAKFGVGPASIPDFLALVGDAADGIPGVPRWGEKAAAAALAKVLHVEAIPADPSAWTFTVRGKEGLAASLNEHREVVGLYKTLATLRTDVPLQENLQDLEWPGADRGLLTALAARLGDEDLVAAVPRWRA
ncbi:MAG: flap endonuclease [Deltaproteobacteria bacterium]|nr:flap endonuclease [Deltaproteobacteria bacterium]